MNVSLLNQRWIAGVIVLQALLIFVPLIILGAATGWPASLDDPASEMLPTVYDNLTALRIGYFSYLVYSLLIFPVALLLQSVLHADTKPHILLRAALGFALASTIFRAIGIIRWLSIMPILADQYVQADAAQQQNIAVVYNAVNEFGGAIGEILGVQLLAALWIASISLYIIKYADFPNWIGQFGFLSAALYFVGLAEIAGVDLGPFLTFSGTIFHFWLLAIGIALWQRSATHLSSATLSPRTTS